MDSWKTLLWTLLWLVCGAAEAQESQTIQIPLRLTPPEGVEGPVAARLRVTALGGSAAGQSQTMEVQLPALRRFMTSEGIAHRFELEVEGYWSPPKIVVAISEVLPVTFDFFRTGTLTGSLKLPPDAPAPEELLLRFEQAAGRREKPVVPLGFVQCPVDEDRFRCEVPAGLLDLRLRAEGYVSHYLWTFPVPVGGEWPLGKLRLQRGGSIVGHVALEDPSASFEGVRVRASPLQAAHETGAEEVRRDRVNESVGVNTRGFFHLQGLAEGQYRIVAEKKDYGRALAETTVVRSNAETTLPDSLLITPPGRFEVRLDPPQDPYGSAWSVTLQESNPSRTAFELVELGSVDEQGLWSSKELPRGLYTLAVEDRTGSRWLLEDVELDESNELIERRLSGVVVDGRITLGESPLEATLWFGGRHGARSLRLQSDAEGRFGGLLPEEGDWPVYVEADEPHVNRHVAAVEVATSSAGDAAWVELELPDHRLAGRVLDVDGEPVTCSILLQPHDEARRPDQQRTDEEGEFELHGLGVGTYTVQAHASQGSRSSKPIRVEIAEDREPPYLELRLDEHRVVQGRIVASQHAVPGTWILAEPKGSTGETLSQLLPDAQSDVDGRFTLTVPSATQTLDLVILPPGFALTTAQVTLPDEGLTDQTFFVHPAGGTLRLVLEEDFKPSVHRMITVTRDGVDIGLSSLLRWARLQRGGWTAPGRLTLPMVAFGQYEACLREDGPPTCLSAFLPPGGDVELELEREPL